MRKAEKRRLGEEKAKREAEERRQSGLAAQKASREILRKKENRLGEEAQKINQRHRSTLLNNGINPTTGLVFTDTEMTDMEKKANTPERRHLFERIQVGRAVLLDEQPPLNMSDYTDSDRDYVEKLHKMVTARRMEEIVEDPFKGMTVGQFRDMMDSTSEKWIESLRTKG